MVLNKLVWTLQCKLLLMSENESSEKGFPVRKNPVDYPEGVTTNETPCSFVTHVRPLLPPDLRAVFLTLLLDPVVAFQMRGNVAVGSAISSSFVIHFEQPALHLHVVKNELAENANQLWSNDTEIVCTKY